MELVELIVDADYHCISIRFQDNTDLSVVIDPGLRFKAEYSDWKTGNQRVLKRWPARSAAKGCDRNRRSGAEARIEFCADDAGINACSTP